MEFYNSFEENSKRAEFHNPEFLQEQVQMKNLMLAKIIKALDDLTEIVDSNSIRVNQLKEAVKDVNM